MRLILSTILWFTTTILVFAQETYLDKGNDYLNNGKFDEAEKIFRDGINEEPENLIYQCQLGLALIQQNKYLEAQIVLDKVLDKESNNFAANWYSGIGSFYADKERLAIMRFEKTLTLIDDSSEQYFMANWFIGKSYSILLRSEGLTYEETDRMFECYEEYLRLQPNANDAKEIRKYIKKKKKRRPPSNVHKWIDI